MDPIQVPPVVSISNLPTAFNRQELVALLKSFGSIVRVFIPRAGCASAKQRYALVTFSSLTAAQQARKHINGLAIGECVLSTRLHMQTLPKESAKVFVKNLPTSYSIQMFEELFNPQSVIISSELRHDDAGQSLGYGSIQFLTEDMAMQAIIGLNGAKVERKIIVVDSFVRKEKRQLPRGHTLFTKGFDDSMTEDLLHSLFSQFGRLNGVCLRRSPGLSFAFITFDQRKHAEAAMDALHGQEYFGVQWLCSFRVPNEGRMESGGLHLQSEYRFLDGRCASAGKVIRKNCTKYPTNNDRYTASPSADCSFQPPSDRAFNPPQSNTKPKKSSLELPTWFYQSSADTQRIYLGLQIRKILEKCPANADTEKVMADLLRLPTSELQQVLEDILALTL